MLQKWQTPNPKPVYKVYPTCQTDNSCCLLSTTIVCGAVPALLQRVLSSRTLDVVHHKVAGKDSEPRLPCDPVEAVQAELPADDLPIGLVPFVVAHRAAAQHDVAGVAVGAAGQAQGAKDHPDLGGGLITIILILYL